MGWRGILWYAEMKRSYPNGQCADCGGLMKAINRQTKYCAGCRLARAAAWNDGRPFKCQCGSKYVAWAGPRTDRRCGRCFIAAAPTGGRESVEGTCGICHKPGVVHSHDVPCCYPCLHDPKNVETVKKSVTNRYNRRIR